MTGLLLAIDAGQTSTKSLLATTGGEVVGLGQSGSVDHFHGTGGTERNRTAIHAAIRSAFSAARLEPAPVEAAVLGVTAVRRGDPAIHVIHAMVREIVTVGAIWVFSDYVTNLAGASSGGWGVVVVAGGGAIAYGISADRQMEATAGGFGYLLGDEGSAYWIGRRAVNAAIRADDGRGGPTALEGLVKRHFGLCRLLDIVRVVYDADFSRDRLSMLAPSVIEIALAGDRVAQGIVAGAGEELARHALAVTRRIAGAGEPVPVYPTGGVFAAGAPILDPFSQHVHAGWSTAEVRLPDFPPVAGALIEAYRLTGRQPDAAWLLRLRETLPL